MRCISCKYDLSRLAEHRCPECGREFDPNDSRTFTETGHSGPRLRFLAILWMLAFVIGCGLGWRYFLPSPAATLELLAVALVAFVFASMVTALLWPLYVFVAAWWESY